jgi:hypothetical protein
MNDTQDDLGRGLAVENWVFGYIPCQRAGIDRLKASFSGSAPT